MFLRRSFQSSLKQIQQKASLSNYFHYGNVGVAVLRKKDLDIVHHDDPGHDAEVFKQKELFGSGGPVDRVATIEEQATGKERIEYEMTLAGKDPYFGMMDPIKVSKQGTKSDPILVVSPDTDRYVGCIGHRDHPHPHQQVWMQITEDGHKYWEYGHNRCSECGNTFKLKRINLPYPSIN